MAVFGVNVQCTVIVILMQLCHHSKSVFSSWTVFLGPKPNTEITAERKLVYAVCVISIQQHGAD